MDDDDGENEMHTGSFVMQWFPHNMCASVYFAKKRSVLFYAMLNTWCRPIQMIYSFDLILLAVLIRYLIEISRSHTINPFTILVIHKFCLERDASTFIKIRMQTKTTHVERDGKQDGWCQFPFVSMQPNRTRIFSYNSFFYALGFVSPRSQCISYWCG